MISDDDEAAELGAGGQSLDEVVEVAAPAPAAVVRNAGGQCTQGTTYRGTNHEICGGDGNWGATDVEVWYPR